MRLTLIKYSLLFFLGAVVLRLFFWQVLNSEKLIVMAEQQRFESLKVNALRGDISFSDGSALASSQPSYLLYALPKTLSEEKKSKVAKGLATLFIEDEGKVLTTEEKELQLDALKNEIHLQLSKDLYWVSLKRNINQDLKEKIDVLKLEGLGYEQEFSRFYPESSSSAHLLGFVASDSKGEGTGYFGVEGYYNGELKGIPGTVVQEKDALGVPILIGQTFTTRTKNGKNLKLNIDRVVQYIIEKNLKRGMERYGAKSASAIVMDPKTGAVLGLAAYPNYDPGKILEFPKENYKNPTVADSYEPGSTFKVLVMAAAVNEDLVEADTRCDICDGPLKIGGFTIKTWNEKYRADLTMKDVIVHSDNTGMVFVSRKLGLDKMYQYIEDFGFGEVTSIDLQDEASPDLRAKEEWREIDLATSSFGQGIAVSGIQMVRAVSAIANGGYLMEPQIVKEIKDENSLFEIKPKMIKQVITPETAIIITEMMVAAVDEGEAKFAKPKGFRIAGKTGTAQIPVAGHYDPNKTIASFVGFAPADDPKFVMLVRYDQPSSSIFGSETAAPTFFEISKELFPYFKVAPTE
jgi:cell division protein FtsI/penicillin-binding protein 2